MFSRLVRALVVVGALAAGVSGCQNIGVAELPGDGAIDFNRIKPILEARCLPCHQGNLLGATVPDFRTSKEVYDPSRVPRLVVPGEPEKSRLLQVTYLMEETEGAMPPLGHGLTLEEKNLLGEWIRQGADWPDDEVLQSAAVSDMKKAQ